MKRFFLYAVAITALCSACETENEVFATKTNNQTTTLNQAKSTKANYYQIYQSILSSFEYNKSQTYEKNLLLFEQHVNQQIPDYIQQETFKYEKINPEQLLVLEQAEANFIEQLAYTEGTKQVIYAIVTNHFNSETMPFITNEDERLLIETLFALHGNGNDDDLWNRKKNIAFAYGAQYNFSQAVLYAGAIELMSQKP